MTATITATTITGEKRPGWRFYLALFLSAWAGLGTFMSVLSSVPMHLGLAEALPSTAAAMFFGWIAGHSSWSKKIAIIVTVIGSVALAGGLLATQMNDAEDDYKVLSVTTAPVEHSTSEAGARPVPDAAASNIPDAAAIGLPE